MPDLYHLVFIVEGIEDSDTDTQLQAWQDLVNSGLHHQLQGWYGRTAQLLIDQGLIQAPA